MDDTQRDVQAPSLPAGVGADLTVGEGLELEVGDRLVGKVVVDALPYPSLAHVFWLHAVYVHPDARGSGASSKLLRAAIDHACSKGATRIALWVNGANTHARALYERLGFRETGHVPGGIKVGATLANDVLMTLEAG